MLLLLILLILLAPVTAQEKIVPCPPEYVQIPDKQLPGEDPYEISKVVFSPKNDYVAAFFHTTKTFTVWEVKTAQVVAQIPDSVHGLDACDGLEFTDDGKQLIAMRNFLPFKYIDWKEGKVTRSIDMQADPKKILSYAFSPTKDLVALGTYDGIQVWDLKSGTKIKHYYKGLAISGLDLIYYKTKEGKLVRLLAYGRALMPPDLKWKNVAGVMDLDSGKHTPLLNDIPADKKVEDTMCFFWVQFDYSASYVMVSYSVFPPKVKAGVYLIDTWTGKYLANQQLGQNVIKYNNVKYLWKPFYGYTVTTADMSDPSTPYKVATQFLIITKERGLQIIDTIDEKVLPAFNIRYSQDYTLAAVGLKKDATDTCKLWLYRLVPKKK